MSDVILVVVFLALIALCALYVLALDRMIRNDDIEDPATRPVQEVAR